MGKFSAQQKKTVDEAVSFLQKIIDCYKQLPKDKQNIPDKYIKEVERISKVLKKLNKDGKIDFVTKNYTVLANADRKGIHLNDKYGNNYENDYKLPPDYKLDDCKNGKFYALWRLLEILTHELYHYENHTGLNSLKKAGLIIVYATVGNLLEGLSSLFSSKPYLRRKYMGHEHETYGHCRHLFSWINSILSTIWLAQSSDDPCLPCAYRHIKEADKVSERQEPYEWVR